MLDIVSLWKQRKETFLYGQSRKVKVANIFFLIETWKTFSERPFLSDVSEQTGDVSFVKFMCGRKELVTQ